MCPGDVVLAFEATHAWRNVMFPLLEGVEAQRRARRPGEKLRRGRPSQYSAHDFERLELLRRVLGLTSTRATRDWLASDRARKTRRLFALDRVRPHFGGPARVLLENVPSEKTMSNYRKCFPEADRAAAYKAFFEALLLRRGLP